ncbi:PucR family transcriptional regulator [Kribbella sp. CA-293567]|uniref:PucR family transcriptional regulator n=1 Tax=Kribbella sp. CA-293567 TaxID=3002436 RepID=UPI0022DD0503|nr:helix-turn-helix domain-containing protein [Kribbella sp. CA-293567]WBQ04655.1 helix-turn-helix domain-containing protein [Kribbella sp. CA-293567]
MTDHKLLVGGIPAHEVLTRSLGLLVDAVLEQLVAEIPLYTQLPQEELQGDIRRVIDRSLRAFIETFRTGRPPSGEALAPLRESATRRAEEGVPLEAILAAYHLGGRICADHVAAGFRPEELADALTLNRLILDFLQTVTAVVSASYFEERQIIAGEDLATRQSLLTTLLDGGPATEVARRAGLHLPSRYAVLGLAFGAHADEQQPGVDIKIVARRKLRRIRLELDRTDGGPSMSSLTPVDGIALLSESPASLEELRQRMSRAAGVQVTVAAAGAVPEEVPAAVALVRELLEVVRIYRLPAGVHRLEDLVLEYQLTRPSPARDQLAGLMTPLATRPDLLQTLRCYLSHGRNRRQTAAELHVHANTVDYRLRQVGKLTGLDPAQTEQLPRLVAALAAHDAS